MSGCFLSLFFCSFAHRFIFPLPTLHCKDTHLIQTNSPGRPTLGPCLCWVNMPPWPVCPGGKYTMKQTLCFTNQLLMWWDFTTAILGKQCRNRNCHKTGCCNIILHYLQPTSQTEDHNTRLSNWLGVSCPLRLRDNTYSRDREERLERHEEGGTHKKIWMYLMLLPLCTTCRGKQWSKAFHHVMLAEY